MIRLCYDGRMSHLLKEPAASILPLPPPFGKYRRSASRIEMQCENTFFLFCCCCPDPPSFSRAARRHTMFGTASSERRMRERNEKSVLLAAKSMSEQIDRWLWLIGACIVLTVVYLATLAPPLEALPEKSVATAGPAGVAALCCFDGPAWMQRRYATVVGNLRANLPRDWAVQIFHRDDDSYQRGLALNPGLARSKDIVWTSLDLKRKKRSDLVLSLELWRKLAADVVLFSSTSAAICANGPPFSSYLDFPYLADRNGAMLLVRRHQAIRSVSFCFDLFSSVYVSYSQRHRRRTGILDLRRRQTQSPRLARHKPQRTGSCRRRETRRQ